MTVFPVGEWMTQEMLEQIVQIELESFSDPWSASSFIYESKAGRLFCLFEEERIAGYLVMWTIADECEIANLAVSAASRRRGVATAMLKYAFSCGAQRYFLEVRPSNTGARALYNKLGFREYARRKNYYHKPKEDAILLCREGLPEDRTEKQC